MKDVPIHKHVYKVFFAPVPKSIKVMAFDKADAKVIAMRSRPDVVIAKVKKIAD